MKRIWKIVKQNYWIVDLIINTLNQKAHNENKNYVYTYSNFQPIIRNWSKNNISINNKVLITKAINSILWTNYTINELEEEVET